MIYLKHALFLWTFVFATHTSFAEDSFTELLDAQRSGKMDLAIIKNDNGKFSVHYEIAQNNKMNLSPRKPNRIEGTDWYLVHEKSLSHESRNLDFFVLGNVSGCLLSLVLFNYWRHKHSGVISPVNNPD